MERSRYLFGMAMAVAVVVGMYGIQGVHAKSEKEYITKAKATTLVKGPLVGVGVQGGAGYAALNGINGMRKIPQMSLRQILPVNHNCAHYCKLKAVEICNILNHKGVQKKKCLDKSFDLCLSMLRYGDC